MYDLATWITTKLNVGLPIMQIKQKRLKKKIAKEL